MSATAELPAELDESEALVAALTAESDLASVETEAAFAELRRSSQAIAALVDEVFDDFELMGSELTSRSVLIDQLQSQLRDRTESLRLLERAEAELRAELAAAEHELTNSREQLNDLPLQVQQLREQLHGIELERCSLEVELEALRVRAAELTDQLVELKRDSSEERAEWSSELKQLRRSLERQAELFADRLSAQQHAHHESAKSPPVSGTAGHPPAAETANVPTAAASDAVLGSVISQFEALQKDRQRRRGK